MMKLDERLEGLAGPITQSMLSALRRLLDAVDDADDTTGADEALANIQAARHDGDDCGWRFVLVSWGEGDYSDEDEGTTADRISAQFEDDGSQLAVGDVNIHDICKAGSAERHSYSGVTFYVFADESIMMVGDDAWDIVYPVNDIGSDVHYEVETARIDVSQSWQDSHGDTVALLDTDGDLRTITGHVYAWTPRVSSTPPRLR